MEELTEMLTWYQLGLHKKPIGLLNIDGYYDHFLQWVRPGGEILSPWGEGEGELLSLGVPVRGQGGLLSVGMRGVLLFSLEIFDTKMYLPLQVTLLT